MAATGRPDLSRELTKVTLCTTFRVRMEAQMITQSMETSLSPQATSPPFPNNDGVSDGDSPGDNDTGLLGGGLPSKGVVTALGKWQDGRDTGPDGCPCEERGITRGR
jgi:hypothetical protein